MGLSPRVVIEAASSFGWHKYLRDNDSLFCIDTFGESGKAEDLYNYFGLRADDIAKNIIKNKGSTSLSFRKKMAAKAFETSSKYDLLISNWLKNKEIYNI